MNKAEYREYFAECRSFLKMSYFLKMACIGESNFSYFMKGNDFLLSTDKLNALYTCISSVVSKKIE